MSVPAARGRFASLPMYDFPELEDAHDALWAAIAERLAIAGLPSIPRSLIRSEDLLSLWRDPGLLLGQTCGYPLMTDLTDQVQLVATPVYRATGCQGAFHRSAIVVRADDDAADLAGLRGRRCAINGRDSNTGMNLLRAAIAPLAGREHFFRSIIVTGSHRRSLALLAKGEADVAGIDCVTLAHMTRIDPTLVAGTRVLTWSPASPGLPMITAATTGATEIDALRRALADIAGDPALSGLRETLLIEGFEMLSRADYASVIAFERQAEALGYPHLA